MDMRECKKCNIKLIKGTQFNSDTQNGFNICKSCRTNRVKKHYANNKESYLKSASKGYNAAKSDYKVYILEDENYVGVTGNMKWRMSQHRHLNKNTNNVRILYSTKNRDIALELEELLHDMGYEGKHLNNRYS